MVDKFLQAYLVIMINIDLWILACIVASDSDEVGTHW